jgi:hypothetical protein
MSGTPFEVPANEGSVPRGDSIAGIAPGCSYAGPGPRASEVAAHEEQKPGAMTSNLALLTHPPRSAILSQMPGVRCHPGLLRSLAQESLEHCAVSGFNEALGQLSRASFLAAVTRLARKRSNTLDDMAPRTPLSSTGGTNAEFH